MRSIIYTKFDSPFGTMAIARTQKGICRVIFPEEKPFHKTLSTLYPNQTIVQNPDPFTKELSQLKQYFSGEKVQFEMTFDLTMPPFYSEVLTEVHKIPYGETASYKNIAERVRNPGAVRAVGSANAQNPIPIIIPCHRVIAHNGSLGGYGGNLDRKYFLLRLEGAI